MEFRLPKAMRDHQDRFAGRRVLLGHEPPSTKRLQPQHVGIVGGDYLIADLHAGAADVRADPCRQPRRHLQRLQPVAKVRKIAPSPAHPGALAMNLHDAVRSRHRQLRKYMLSRKVNSVAFTPMASARQIIAVIPWPALRRMVRRT